jgi:hypothetical protein
MLLNYMHYVQLISILNINLSYTYTAADTSGRAV